MRALPRFWLEKKLAPGKVALARLGTLRIWLARAAREWGVAVEYGDALPIIDHAQVPPDVVPEGLSWTHIAFHDAPSNFAFKPGTPDRAVVVRPPHPVTIPIGERATFFARVPVWITILTGEKQDLEMGTVPSQVLSDTWFGDYAEGLLCYSLPLTAQRDAEAHEVLPHHIVCPIEVMNKGNDPLVFEKLSLRVDYLTLFGGERHLWSSPLQIVHEDKGRSSRVEYSTKPPAMEKDLEKLVEAKKSPERGLSRLVFQPSMSSDFKSS